MTTTTMKAISMTAYKPWRAKSESVTMPRQYNGNVFAVGAYLRRLRELNGEGKDGWSREKIAERIRNNENGIISLSGSAINVIESGRLKSFDVAMISAFARAVGGSMDDIDDLLRVEFTEGNDDSYRESKRIGFDRAMRRWGVLQRGEDKEGSVLHMASSTDMRKTLEAVLTSAELQEVVNATKDNPNALSVILTVLRNMAH